MAYIVASSAWIWLYAIDDAFRTGVFQIAQQTLQCSPTLTIRLSSALRKARYYESDIRPRVRCQMQYTPVHVSICLLIHNFRGLLSTF